MNLNASYVSLKQRTQRFYTVDTVQFTYAEPIRLIVCVLLDESSILKLSLTIFIVRAVAGSFCTKYLYRALCR